MNGTELACWAIVAAFVAFFWWVYKVEGGGDE